jgi:putrescine aminotransferase
MTREHAALEQFARSINPAFVAWLRASGFGRVFVRARDVWLRDDRGRRVLDCLAGFGASNIGHAHPRLMRRLARFLREDALNIIHVEPSPQAAACAEDLAAAAGPPLDRVIFSSSGAEAVEAAMKLARGATGRPGFISCDGAYHGMNLGSLSVMGSRRARRAFEPLLPGCVRIPYGDLDALSRALRPRRAAAFLVEPLQAAGGVLIPPPGYLREAQRLCRAAGTLLILDEVHNGLGRLGRMFAFHGEGFVPDVLTLAKSLGGGIAAIGATLTRAGLHSRVYGSADTFDLQGSTFGGNAFACVAARETLAILRDEKLSENAAARGAELLDRLRRRLSGHPLVREVRGRGLFVGIQLEPVGRGWSRGLPARLVRLARGRMFGEWAALELLDRGVLSWPCIDRSNVIKFEPPLTLRESHVDRIVDAVAGALDGPLESILRRVDRRLRASGCAP